MAARGSKTSRGRTLSPGKRALAMPSYDLELALKMLGRAHTRATLQLRMMELFIPPSSTGVGRGVI
jgi:hypothetical protein